jgi:hypothetical protein
VPTSFLGRPADQACRPARSAQSEGRTGTTRGRPPTGGRSLFTVPTTNDVNAENHDAGVTVTRNVAIATFGLVRDARKLSGPLLGAGPVRTGRSRPAHGRLPHRDTSAFDSRVGNVSTSTRQLAPGGAAHPGHQPG